ncbi:MAG: alpha-ribazole phosphatase [Candidatus Eremiobacterota bacterium]
MIELILIRHGETDINKKQLYCGWNETELNNSGIKEAEQLRDVLSGEKIDVIYSSDLRRSLHTAEIINSVHSVSVIPSYGLRELNFGQWQDISCEEIGSLYPEEYKKWSEDWLSYRIPGGESMIDFYDRVTKTSDEIIETNKNSKILIVTHSGPIRCIMSKYIGENINTHWHFRVSLGSIIRIEFLDGFAILTEIRQRPYCENR